IIENLIGTNYNGDFETGFGNTGAGIVFDDTAGSTASGNTIRGNATGIGIGGTDAQQNLLEGNVITNSATDAVLIINGASLNTIGGTGDSAGNILSKNQRGVSIESGSHNNPVIGNLIGTDENGQLADGFGNTQAGIVLDSAPSNTV